LAPTEVCTARGIRVVALAAACLVIFPNQAAAQNAAMDPDDLVNHGVPRREGFANDNVADQSTFAFVIRPSLMLRQYEPDRLGLRLRLGLGFAIVQFDRPDLPDLEDVQALAFIPGLEFIVPLSRASVLEPFFDVGLGTAFAENDPFWVFTLGLNSEFVYLRKRWELGLEPLAEFNLTRSKGRTNDDQSAQIGLRADARHPLWFRMGSSQPTVGLYGYAGYFFVPIEFTAQNNVQKDINAQFELGVLFSFERRPKIWFIRVPTLRIGYGFGDGLAGLRIRLGGDRVVNLYADPTHTVETDAEIGP